MKSRKVKAAAKSKIFMSKKKLKGNIPVESDSGPDVDSDSMYHDDIDDFHKREDEKLSTDDELIKYDDSSSEEEEVLPITDDEKDDWNEENIDENDVVDENEGLPNSEAWGKKKYLYYNADFVDEDRGRSYREKDAEAAKAEEEEALAIQKSVLSNINADSLGANLQFEESGTSSEEEEEKYDWASISKEDKLRYLKKTSPEFFIFVKEFKEKMTEIKERIEPLLNLVKENNVPPNDFGNYIKLKYQVLLHYCMNIGFYMVLKCKGPILSNHPILQRIKSYKKLLDQLSPVDEKVQNDVSNILERLQRNEIIFFNNKEENDKQNLESQEKSNIVNEIDQSDLKGKKKKKNKSKQKDTETEREIISLYLDAKEKQAKQEIDTSNPDMEIDEIPAENIAEEKRMITYQIAKNKGLIPNRKKEYRNPRVRHRMKFKRAKIRRKGQVREAIREIKRYEGEPTGISTHVVKSIKLK